MSYTRQVGVRTSVHEAMERESAGMGLGASIVEGGRGRLKPLPVCRLCSGSAVDGMTEDPCPRCSGTGDEPRPQESARATVKAISVDDAEWWA